MADTGWKSPQATGGVYNDFTTPANAYTSNNQYASRLMADGFTYRQSYSNFDFGIPAGATINGIEVKIEGYSSTQIVLWHFIHSTSGGQDGSDTITHHTSEDTQIIGGPTDLWSCSWVSSDFSDGNFYMYFMTDSDGTDGISLYIDQVQVKVYYTEGTNQKINIGDSWKDIESMKINIGDSWKDVESIKINVGDTWKTVF